MHPTIQRAGLLCAAYMLLSCATHEHLAPAPILAFAAISPDEAYLMGRQHQLARNSADAMRMYRQALASDPQHVSARNGLATVLAEQGDFSAAIDLWKSLTAPLGKDPSAAYLFNNLGFAYFLSGQYALAQEAQERACLLDPANPLAWQRLASTLDKLGDADRAARLQRQAQTLLAHDPHADAALAGASPVNATPAPDDGWSRVELVQGTDGLLTLSRTHARQVAAVTMAPAASLEIMNGNGVPGMARATAQRVREAGLTTALRTVRLSNQAGFGVRRTRIEYRPLFKPLAERVAQRVQPGAPLIEAPADVQAGQVDVRVVLGRDAVRPAG